MCIRDRDHKRAGDGDTGLNTGGMGTFSPSPFYTEEVDEFCKKYIYQATVDAMAAEGREFKGIIFFGLMPVSYTQLDVYKRQIRHTVLFQLY